MNTITTTNYTISNNDNITTTNLNLNNDNYINTSTIYYTPPIYEKLKSSSS